MQTIQMEDGLAGGGVEGEAREDGTIIGIIMDKEKELREIGSLNGSNTGKIARRRNIKRGLHLPRQSAPKMQI